MSGNAWLQVLLYVGVLLALSWPLGVYISRVFGGGGAYGLERVLGPIERWIYRLAGVKAEVEQHWTRYAVGMLLFNFLGLFFVYGLQRVQGMLPMNPAGFGAVSPDLAFNTAVSFATNTNWQSYSGEQSLSYLTQMLALTVQNFVSAATGIACLVALVRGLARASSASVGNFWVDLVRSTLYVLLPLSVVLAVVLVSQGVVQTFSAYRTIPLMQPITYEMAKTDAQGSAVVDDKGNAVMEKQTATEVTVPLGPAASQVAIKQLGTNGGGFFGVNSAHPFENPTPLSNFISVISILLIPAALCFTFGDMVKDRRQGYTVLAAMLVIFVPLCVATVWAETRATPALSVAGVDVTAGNMEGKEIRFGAVNSAIWAAATTAASNGSVNAMHDSFTPVGGLIPMWLIQLGEVVFGGVGSGLYGMLIFAIIAVFVAGLMVGRTPEYLGKKIEAFEMKMASVVILIPPAVVLMGAAIACVHPEGISRISNPGAHGFSQILYWASSTGNNNGSAFAGLGTNNWLYNLLGGLLMLASRYWLAIPVLAIAGSLAAKKKVPESAGTLQTHTPLFVALLVGSVLLVGALTFVPALALGPVVEHLQMK